MQIHENNSPADPGAIEALERELRTELPEQYRTFLAQYNGGYPEPDGFSFYNRYPKNHFESNTNVSKAILDRFLGLYDGEYDNLKKYLEVYKGRIPANMIPVAHDPGGNLICLALTGDDAGKIFYWKHDEEVEENETPDYRNIYFVAQSFDEFLSSLVDFS